MKQIKPIDTKIKDKSLFSRPEWQKPPEWAKKVEGVIGGLEKKSKQHSDLIYLFTVIVAVSLISVIVSLGSIWVYSYQNNIATINSLNNDLIDSKLALINQKIDFIEKYKQENYVIIETNSTK